MRERGSVKWRSVVALYAALAIAALYLINAPPPQPRAIELTEYTLPAKPTRVSGPVTDPQPSETL